MTVTARSEAMAKWRGDGIRVIKGDALDPAIAQTPGMFRAAAVTHARVGAHMRGRYPETMGRHGAYRRRRSH